MTTNALPNALTLARRAGVPCPEMDCDGFSFAVWTDQETGRWGHIDVARNRVTMFNPETGRHEPMSLALTIPA